MGQSRFINPDSALVRVAEDVLARHSAAESNGRCGSCGDTTPCPPAIHANEVRLAAGLSGPVTNERPHPERAPGPRVPLNKPIFPAFFSAFDPHAPDLDPV